METETQSLRIQTFGSSQSQISVPILPFKMIEVGDKFALELVVDDTPLRVGFQKIDSHSAKVDVSRATDGQLTGSVILSIPQDFWCAYLSGRTGVEVEIDPADRPKIAAIQAFAEAKRQEELAREIEDDYEVEIEDDIDDDDGWA